MVTGATGFVGRHVVERLLERGHQVLAIARDLRKAREMPWFGEVQFAACDLHGDFAPLFRDYRHSDALVHLAWPGLPNYRDYSHIENNLPGDLAFLKACVLEGVSQLLVTGTCLEYGMQYGPLPEDAETRPITPYGLAKDALRKALQLLQKSRPFTLQWVRLFYLTGTGQNAGSLLSQLDRAIDQGQAVFDMSCGDQLRDYMPVTEAARDIVRLLETPLCQGIINCCSGEPVSVRDLVERHCRDRQSRITLNRGHYPYPDYEPLAFWGIPTKLKACRQMAPDLPGSAADHQESTWARQTVRS